jgi:hypothetical protein
MRLLSIEMVVSVSVLGDLATANAWLGCAVVFSRHGKKFTRTIF